MPPRPDVLPPSTTSSSSGTGAGGGHPPSAAAAAAGGGGASLAAAANSREPANSWLLNAKGTAGELRASQRDDLGIDHSAAAAANGGGGVGGSKKKTTRLLPTQRRRPEKVDSSTEAQHRLIERSFDDLAHSAVDRLRFPGKPHLRVVEVRPSPLPGGLVERPAAPSTDRPSKRLARRSC